MESLRNRAKDITATIEGGYIPNACLTNYFSTELNKQKMIDIQKAIRWYRNQYKFADRKFLDSMCESLKRAMEE